MSTAATDFVPASFDGTDWKSIEPLIDELENRPIESAEDYERWLIDRSEFEAACSEDRGNLYINMTCHTDNDKAQKAYADYIENISPRLKPRIFALDQRQKELAERFPLDPKRYEVLDRDTAAEVELFRKENVPLETELDRLATQYQKITGAMSVKFEGREQTLPQMQRYQEDADRDKREKAWRAVAERRIKDANDINAIYDQMISLRHRVASNAGFDNYVGYAFKNRQRFDYTPEDCKSFHDAVERAVVPFNRSLDDRRKELLGVDPLRPWDLLVDPKGRAPLRPFENGPDLVNKTHAALRQLDPRLAEMFARLGDGKNDQGITNGASLDLESRKGKAPGGYQIMRDRQRMPFIFMNAAGLHRDVETMVHEAGHAFHSMLCSDDPLVHYRHYPTEFAEVASMSMELLTMPYWGGEDGFYPDEEDLARAQRKQLEGSVSILSWIATIDAFQHWIYTNNEHSRDERCQHWLELDDRFGPRISWDGIEDFRRTAWQRQLHLFSHPFYYIEYGIAQLGSLQLWVRALEEGEKTAIESYMKALSLGGSRPLPDLFNAAGLKFDFGYDTIARLMERVSKELEKLPD